MAEFANIKKEDCVKKSLPKGAKINASHTLVLQSVINAIKAHGRSSMHKEVCGVLVGNLCWDKEPFLLIDARIEGKYADHQAGSVTFTSETWNYIHSELSEKYPQKQIVGWYHTHPGFGIFLSNMDFFIHENFFSPRWQPAYVFDPQAETEGFFFWNKDNLSQETVPVILDESPVNVESTIKKSKEKISVVLTGEDEKEENKKRLRTGLMCVLIALLIVIDILVIYMLFISIKENKQLGEEIFRLKKNNKEQREDFIKVQGELEKFKADTAQERNTDIEEQKKLFDNLLKRVKGLDNQLMIQVKKHNAEYTKLQTDLTSLYNQLKKEGENDNAEFNALHKELTNVRNQLKKDESVIAALHKDLTSIHNQLIKQAENNNAVIAVLRKDFANVNERYEAIVNNLGHSSNILASIQKKISDIDSQIKALDEARIKAEEEKRLAEEKRIAEEKRLAEEKRIQEEKQLVERRALEEAQKDSNRWYHYLLPWNWF